MSEVRTDVERAMASERGVRLTGLLDALGVARSSWYCPIVPFWELQCRCRRAIEQAAIGFREPDKRRER